MAVAPPAAAHTRHRSPLSCEVDVSHSCGWAGEDMDFLYHEPTVLEATPVASWLGMSSGSVLGYWAAAQIRPCRLNGRRAQLSYVVRALAQQQNVIMPLAGGLGLH